MGAAASTDHGLEQMLACTMILGEAMVKGLDPRFVKFPGLYRLYDFHVGPKKQPFATFQQGQRLVMVVGNPDADGKFQQAQVAKGAGSDVKKDSQIQEAAITNEKVLVVRVGGDSVVLDREKLNEPNGDGWTPLHASCHSLNTQEAGFAILEELIQSKANLNIKTKRGPGSFSCGWTPLQMAVAYGLENLALKLIRTPGVEINVENSLHWTPLYEACHRGYTNIARELLKAGAKTDVICPEFALCPYPGQRPLAEAARQGHLEVTKLLLEWGVDKNATNKIGWTALHEAAYHSRTEIVQALVVYGVDVTIRTGKGSLANDVTINRDLRAMLEETIQQAEAAGAHTRLTTSPKKDRSMSLMTVSSDSNSGLQMAKQVSPTKATSFKVASPLSRKEDYALLGDLPSLKDRVVPSISIQDGTEDEVKEEEAKEDIGNPEGSNNSSSPKKKTKSKHKSKSRSKKQVPEEFKCAVSLKVMKEPMRSPLGHVFERKVVEAWFRDFGNRCPLTGEALSLSDLTLDTALQDKIQEWKHGPAAKKNNAVAEGEEKVVAESKEDINEQDEDLYDF